MRAARHSEYGPPSAVSVVENAPRPTPGDGELLVEVHGTTVNRADCGY
jgi:NADPH:quinone reductase-like Zn-dependent oxidoreductase